MGGAEGAYAYVYVHVYICTKMHKHDMSELVSQTLQSTLVPIKASCISVEYRMSIIYIYIYI